MNTKKLNKKVSRTTTKIENKLGVVSFIKLTIVSFAVTSALVAGFFSEYSVTEIRHPFRSPIVIEKRGEGLHVPIVSAKEIISNDPIVNTPTPTEKPLPYESKIKSMNSRQKEVMRMTENKLGKKWAELIYREASFDPEAINATSGACGLPQALPCSKMKCELHDINCQLEWIEEYVTRRYQTIENALAFHDANDWY